MVSLEFGEGRVSCCCWVCRGCLGCLGCSVCWVCCFCWFLLGFAGFCPGLLCLLCLPGCPADNYSTIGSAARRDRSGRREARAGVACGAVAGFWERGTHSGVDGGLRALSGRGAGERAGVPVRGRRFERRRSSSSSPRGEPGRAVCQDRAGLRPRVRHEQRGIQGAAPAFHRDRPIEARRRRMDAARGGGGVAAGWVAAVCPGML